MESTHLGDISRVNQLAIAPVFLLTAVATLITALNIRLGRAIDRRRVLHERVPQLTGNPLAEAHVELRLLVRRIRIIYFAILAAGACALLVCVVIAAAFLGALLSVELARTVAVLFVLAMFALIACLGMLLREVFLAVTDGTHRLMR
jgi:hypothetical protein